jgi:hypothetical protein
MSNYIPFFSIIGVAMLIILCVEFDCVRRIVAKLFIGTVAVAIVVYGCCALQNAARAESEYYDIVAIIKNIEDSDCEDTDVIIEVDNLNDKWAYYEKFEDAEFGADKVYEDMALKFLIDYGVDAETLLEKPVVKGRIVVIRISPLDTDSVEDDEIMWVYYSQFVTR